MAAQPNLSELASSHNSCVPRHGVLTLSGYGINVNAERGHLLIEDGIGSDRHRFRFSKIGHGLKRLVVVGNDGCVSLAALRWLADQKASFVMLDRDGTVSVMTGPTNSSDIRLRRAQALATSNGVGLEICRILIRAKLQEQEHVLRECLDDSSAANKVSSFRNRLDKSQDADAIRILEAQAAMAYFAAWSNLRVMWPKVDLKRVPEHWLTVGNRHSPLSGGPRLAVTPVHAILNYCFAILETETRIAVSTLGLDPGLGMGLHKDTRCRDSLVFDVLEPVRPQVERWLIDWIRREPFRRADFFEARTGNCRLMSNLCSKLSQTAPSWAKLVAPWAEYVAKALWTQLKVSKSQAVFPTHLTQQHRKEAKGQVICPTISVVKPDRLCRGCGKQVRWNSRFCSDCNVDNRRDNFNAGRRLAQTDVSLAKRSETARQQKLASLAWDRSQLPKWLTREVYINRIQPALASIAKRQIRITLGVSEPYSADIQTGKRIPHPRHWETLAILVGVSD